MRRLSVLFFVALLLVAACKPSPREVADLGGNAERAVACGNSFGLDMYRQLGRQKGNLFFSPPSIDLVLGMAWSGAAGETFDEMARVLHLTSQPDSSLADMAAFLVAMDRQEKPYTLAMANRVWGQEGFDFDPHFVERLNLFFGGGFAEADFRTRPAEERDLINSWVADQTRQRISGLLPQGSIDRDTRLVLTNAVYFQSNWAHPFKQDATQDRDFFTAGEAVSVPTMSQSENFLLFEDKELQILALPYVGDDLDFIVVLPRAMDGLERLEQQLSLPFLESRIAAMEKQWTHVELPRLEFTQAIDLRKPLVEMGMNLAFTPGEADFSGITRREPLHISAAVHKSFLVVDERGTEAAAASGMTFGVTSMPPTATLFRANHPFLILIRDRVTGSFLFMGRVADPR